MRSRLSGFIQLPLLVVLMVISVALPVASRLVSQNQATIGKATGSYCPCATTTCQGSTCLGEMGQTCQGIKTCTQALPPCTQTCDQGSVCSGGPVYTCGKICGYGSKVCGVSKKDCPNIKKWTSCDGYTRKCESQTVQVDQGQNCPVNECGGSEGNSSHCGYKEPPKCDCDCAADKYTDQNCAGSCGQSCQGTIVRPTSIPPTSTPVPVCTTTGICSDNSDCCSGACFGGLCQSTTTTTPQPTMTPGAGGTYQNTPTPIIESTLGGRKVLMKVENFEEAPTVIPTLAVSVDTYAPSLQTTVKTINGQVYETETGKNIGDLGVNSDLLVTTGSKIGFTQVDQYDYVTANSYQSAYVSDLFSKLDRVYQPNKGLSAVLAGVPGQTDIVNQITSSVQNENLRQVNSFLKQQLVYNQEMVGVFSPASVGLDPSNKVTYDAFVEVAWNNYNNYNRNIEVLVKDQKGVCFDFSVLMQMYLATKNVETELVFSRSLQHNFLLTLDKKDEVQVVDPTVGIVTSLATHSKEKQYTDLRFYKPIISPLSQTGNDASIQITTIAQKAVCQLKPLDPGCQDPSLLIPTK